MSLLITSLSYIIYISIFLEKLKNLHFNEQKILSVYNVFKLIFYTDSKKDAKTAWRYKFKLSFKNDDI